MCPLHYNPILYYVRLEYWGGKGGGGEAVGSVAGVAAWRGMYGRTRDIPTANC